MPQGTRNTYWSVRLASNIDGLYRVDNTIQGDTYCVGTNRAGEKIYTESCENNSGQKIFSDPQDIVNEERRLVEEACKGPIKQVGRGDSSEYAGTSPVSCSSRKIGNTLSTDCYGGNVNFNYVAQTFYRCEKNNPTADVSKNTLPENDKKFLDNMLKTGKINQNQYDNILHGTALTTDTEDTPPKEESKDLFLDY